MKLPKEAINEFKKIYTKQNGEDISDAKANELANKLLNLFKLVYTDLPVNENDFTTTTK